MKRLVIGLLVVCAVFTVKAEENEIRKLEDFDRLEVSRGVEVILTQGEENSALIISEHMDLNNIVTEIKGSTLKISLTQMIFTEVMVQVKLNFTTLQKITARNGAIVRAPKDLAIKNLELEADAGALIEAKVDSDILRLAATKGSVVKVVGSAKHIIAKSTTGSSLYAEKISSAKVEAQATSKGNTYVTATESIDAKGVSGGVVTVYGKPSNVVQSVSLGGKVDFKDLPKENEEKSDTGGGHQNV